ncbi:hypothetical protein YPPY55_0420, partial [Yersinia pestis PY-55]
MHHTKNKRYST